MVEMRRDDDIPDDTPDDPHERVANTTRGAAKYLHAPVAVTTFYVRLLWYTNLLP